MNLNSVIATASAVLFAVISTIAPANAAQWGKPDETVSSLHPVPLRSEQKGIIAPMYRPADDSAPNGAIGPMYQPHGKIGGFLPPDKSKVKNNGTIIDLDTNRFQVK